MTEKHRFSKQCVYTMRKRDNLDFIYRSGGTATFSENKNWKTGYSLFMGAKERQEKMPILFSAADESSGLIYYALLESITINKEHGIYRTTYSFSHLTPLTDTQPRSSLVLLSTGKPLSNNYIRPYAVCRTHDWLKEIERRGLLAEYIVAHALDLADAVRSEWDAYDLLLPNGIKIEVKSAAYIQSWYQKEYSKVLDDKVGDQKQISLQALKKLDPLQVPYEDLSSCIGQLAVEIDLNRNVGSK